MNNSLKNIFEKTGLKTTNGLIYKNKNNRNINARIRESLFALDNNPLIIFKEYLSIEDCEKNFTELLKQVWNLNDVPVLVICLPEQIEIYNGNVFDKDEARLEVFNNADDLPFKIDSIVNGKFLSENAFSKSKKVEDYLLANILKTKEILSDSNLDTNTICGLITNLIFSKYLIDRKLISYSDCEFYEIIENKDGLFNFFNQIEDKFNVQLYKCDNSFIKKHHLKILSNLFKGHDIVKNQKVLTCPYDFSIIPVELISNIYEIFLKEFDEEKSFYTPLFLVDYILDNTVNVKLENSNTCKILDPSCGSGIFLVESLRRIINNCINLNGKISNDELISIVKNNIYGIDNDKNAIYLTNLSITLTVFDYLNISEIDEFKMPDLIGKNLFADDFFNEKGDFNRLNDFDLIAGNPPWGSKDSSHVSNYENKEISQSFLIRTKDFANAKTKIALIVPSKTLYNTNAGKFRKYFLNLFNVEKVLELSAIRKKIFKNSIQPPCVLFYDLNKNESNKIQHESVKPNKLFYLTQHIVIEKLDIKYIKQSELLENDWMWKFLLYGNVVDFQLVKKLKNHRSIKDIIEKEGLIQGSGINMSANPVNDASRYLKYNYLDAGPSKKMLNRYYIDEKSVTKWNKPLVNRARDERIFKPPYVLIKTSTDKFYRCISAFSDKQWVFKDTIVSIKGNQKDIPTLKSIVGVLNSRLFTYFAFLTFSSIGVERNKILETELTDCPYIENEKIISCVDKLSGQRDPEKIRALQDELDDLIFDLIDIDDGEADAINYLFDITIPMLESNSVFDENNNAFRSVDKKELEYYAKLFINHFKHYFNENDGEYLHSEIYVSDYFVGLNFKIDETAPDKTIEFKKDTEIIDRFGNLSITEQNTLYVQKDIKGFTENSFYVIKSNEYKNWHPAIARLDIIEFMN